VFEPGTIALVVCFVAFLSFTIYLLASRDETWRQAAKMPLDDYELRTPFETPQRAEDEPRG
jgi:hypothetical protein